MKGILLKILETRDNYYPLIPRLVVGLVFLSEGIQKFLFPETVGSGRFAKIGFSDPEFTATFVASFEIICGLLMLAGFLVRVAAVPLLIIMITAITTTKIPLLLNDGFWKMAHDSRTDFSMTMLILFILIYGAGKSTDLSILKRKRSEPGS